MDVQVILDIVYDFFPYVLFLPFIFYDQQELDCVRSPLKPKKFLFLKKRSVVASPMY
jgi:hypothetical protein